MTDVNLNFTDRIDVAPPNEQIISTIPDLLSALSGIPLNNEELSFYRGHSSVGYNITPSIYRNNNLTQQEHIIIKELLIRCPNDFSSCHTAFEKLVKMQHYSLPTRLLDITTNPLIALFFACADDAKADGELLVFKVPKAEIRYYDSDTVSVIANLSNRPSTFSLPKNEDKDSFNREAEIQYLLHDIRGEKPHFLPLIQKNHLQSVICVKPKLDNPRIIRQDGAFLLFGIKDKKENPAEIPANYLYTVKGKRLIIKAEHKTPILKQLNTLSINEATVYPEIEKVAQHIKSKYSF